jgi:hypothetical protein
MTYKKNSRIMAMIKLENNLGKDLLDSLIKREVILVRDSNGEIPYQIIYDFSGKAFYDSREKGAVSYECFKELKGRSLLNKYEAHKGFQNFYGLNQAHLEAYKRYLNSLNKKLSGKKSWKALDSNYLNLY